MTLYELELTTLDGTRTTLADRADQALLIVNVASECGLTSQYTGLEALHERYADRGFAVLGFPCNQFGGQEPGGPDDIRACATFYGADFPLFAKIEVNGPDRHPLYARLTDVADADGQAGDVAWNFEKFLVHPREQLIRRFRPTVTPDDPVLVEAVEAALPG
ncbi:glutathione peroxidase [Nitriliruptoraceae bacterium ZYF776]|nr:glutathione peroxidase [Profundirhabdus halotolerans]